MAALAACSDQICGALLCSHWWPHRRLNPLSILIDTCALRPRSLALLQAVQLVPALPTRLLPMLVQNMPHKLRDRSAQCLYLTSLISLCEGKVGPALREGLLGGLVEHLLSIDADIRWEDIVDAPTGELRVVSAEGCLQRGVLLLCNVGPVLSPPFAACVHGVVLSQRRFSKD